MKNIKEFAKINGWKPALNTLVTKVKGKSPEILLGVGVVSIGAGVVLACKSTLKVESVLDTHQKAKDSMEEALEMEFVDYTDADMKKDSMILYTKTAVDLAKLYIPAGLLLTGGVACIIGSHRIMKKRNIALAAAYTVLDDKFKDYRNRVSERYGKDVEYQIRHGLKAETITKTKEVDGKKVKEEVIVKDENGFSKYVQVFGPDNWRWHRNEDINMAFLNAQQNYLNDRLHSIGHVSLNEVYDALGFGPTNDGVVVGWTLKGDGDGYIDFGLFNEDKDFIGFMDEDGSIPIDFNVDGLIFGKVGL